MGKTGVEDRVPAGRAGTPADTPTEEHPVLTPRSAESPSQALHVLTAAQHAAAEHIAAAGREADRIRRDAEAAAERVDREARAHAAELRGEADRMLTAADAALQRAATEARDRAGEAQRRAEEILAEARAKADGIGQEAKQHADAVERRAHRRYEESVGSLRTRRDLLRQRVHALEKFDTEHRARLTLFIEKRLGALQPDQPGN